MNVEKINVQELSLEESKKIDGGIVMLLAVSILAVSAGVGFLVYKLTHRKK